MADTKTSRPARRLSKDDVLSGALVLLDDIGIDALTTRRLAEYLGVRSPSLYWHFPSKEALLEAMAERIGREHHDSPPPTSGTDWRTWFLANALSFRRSLLAYRDGARLHAGTRPRPGDFSGIEAKMVFLRAAGFEAEEAVRLMMATGRFVVGWVLEEQAEPTRVVSADMPDATNHPLLSAGWVSVSEADPEEAFTSAVTLLVDGAEAAMRRRQEKA
ncbi:MAG: Tetracycline repressor protein class A [Luteibacter sp.]|uniref:TetR/AcrR family transcriptional regulator C-terminal domain-containing protein n=1 Tax=Luteibacter sp. TaxID=1886636 RepID=UPI00137DE4EE|nr:TetR/AcrR family transcriptional regulator C-terminal domain-containing protein [Luteibacter sp.]KAF1005237.1 MAG: Tetracycline repressor protein class A [Luteibacter sp.]